MLNLFLPANHYTPFPFFVYTQQKVNGQNIYVLSSSQFSLSKIPTNEKSLLAVYSVREHAIDPTEKQYSKIRDALSMDILYGSCYRIVSRKLECPGINLFI